MSTKVTPEDKLNYQNEIKDLKSKIADKKGNIGKLEKEMKDDSYGLEKYYQIAIANEYLEMVHISCEMSKVSENYLKKKSDDFLNDGRKTYFKALIELEKVVGNFVDNPLHENQDILKTINKVDPKRVLNLINKLKNTLKLIEDGYGENSKYKWSFVDMQGRYITVFKNFLDYKRLSVNDPRDPYFAENVQLFNMIKLYLQEVSYRFRDKYMVGTKEVVDIKQGINFQEALRKITSLLGTQEESETAKKTIESWKQMLEKEEKNKEEHRKRQAKTKN
ncbi:MAG: hypothetical protein OEV44_00975 [Spirochaetota bacterium]|nr:hypothetical protein [Spirochaetota bacterium]